MSLTNSLKYFPPQKILQQTALLFDKVYKYANKKTHDELTMVFSSTTDTVCLQNLEIQLGRRFRALKLWFVLRNMGISGLQQYLRKVKRIRNYFCWN